MIISKTKYEICKQRLFLNIHICVYEVIRSGLPYMFFSRKNIKNIISFISRGLYTLMLATYIRHIWVCSVLISLSSDIKKNPGLKPSSCDKVFICYWNLNSIWAHNYYARMFQRIISAFYAYEKLILIREFLATTTI